MDRRRHLRFVLSAPVNFICKERYRGECEGSGYTRDVSKQGLFIVTNALVPVGAKVHLEIKFRNPNPQFPLFPVVMKARGRVLRVETGAISGRVEGFAVRTGSLDFANEDRAADIGNREASPGTIKRPRPSHSKSLQTQSRKLHISFMRIQRLNCKTKRVSFFRHGAVVQS
jgi:hypothetical protein